jgi:glycosyltransferase involved in cell wall biosynthesis
MAAPYRVAYLVTHPIQYQAPLLRHLAADERLKITTFFLSNLSVGPYRDAEFDREVAWDVPLLEGYPHRFLPGWGPRNRVSFWRPLTYGLGDALERRRFDALWVHGYAHNALLRGMALARRRRLRILLRGESHLMSHPRGRLKTLVKAIVLRRFFRGIDGFLTIGRLNREYYLHYGVPEGRLFPMPYAVDNDFFRSRAEASREDRERLRAELRLPAGAPVILFAAKLIPRKRPQDLLEAYGLLPADRPGGPSAALVFVGDGPLRQPLESRAVALGFQAVRFAGFHNQTEMPRYYDLCDVFVLPSEHEPWGLVVNEVLNAGRPVVVSDHVGAAFDLVEEGVNGHIVPVGAVGALARILSSVVADRERAAEMGRRSLHKVRALSFEADRKGLLSALAAVTGR